MRLTLVCSSAAKLPMVMESSAEPQTSGSQLAADGLESGHEDAQEDGEGGGFRTGGKEGRDRRGRALVDVRRPDLERRGRNFEAQPDEHQRRRQADEHRRLGASGPISTARTALRLMVPVAP